MHACVACPMHGSRFGAWLGPSLGLWGHGPGAVGARIQGWRPCLGTVGPGLPQHPWRLVPGQSGQAWNGSGSKAVPGILHTLVGGPGGGCGLGLWVGRHSRGACHNTQIVCATTCLPMKLPDGCPLPLRPLAPPDDVVGWLHCQQASKGFSKK